MINASAIIINSKPWFSIILIPKRGKLLKISGSTAQCMAHATDAAIPKASQLILNFIKVKVHYCNDVAKC
jgi:hypothetical protein